MKKSIALVITLFGLLFQLEVYSRPKLIIGLSGEGALKTYSVNFKNTYSDPVGRLAYSARVGIIFSSRYYIWVNISNYVKDGGNTDISGNLGLGYVVNPKAFIGFYPKVEVGFFNESIQATLTQSTTTSIKKSIADIGVGAGLKLNKTFISPFVEAKYQIFSRMPVVTLGVFLKI